MRLFYLTLLLTLTMPAFAGIHDSITEQHYRSKNPALFEQYQHAHRILNNWQGMVQRLDEAGAILSQIIETDETFAPAYREYGKLLNLLSSKVPQSEKMGILSSSESSIMYAIQLAPDYADAYVMLGHLYTEQDRLNEAKDALAKAQELGPNSPWFEVNLANYYVKTHNDPLAIPHFTRMADITSDNDQDATKAKISAVRSLARLYARNNDVEKSTHYYEQTLILEPDSAWAWGNYAAASLYQFGHVDNAISRAKKALSMMDYGHARQILASAYCTKWALNSDNPASKQYLDLALQIVPDSRAIIAKTQQYQPTQICADRLMRYIPSI